MAEKRILRPKRTKTGLTLPELLTVIATIAFLISILMPGLRRVKIEAHDEVRCKANLRQVGIVIQMFLQEEDFRMPDCHVIYPNNDSNPM